MRPLSLEMALNLKRLQLIKDELRRFPKEARDVSGKYLKTNRLFLKKFLCCNQAAFLDEPTAVCKNINNPRGKSAADLYTSTILMGDFHFYQK